MSLFENICNAGTVLVVNDNPAVLIVINAILTASKYRVLVATTVEDALHLFRQKHIHIDAALLDLRMTGKEGTPLASELLSIRPEARVLYMSGFLDDQIIRIKLPEPSNERARSSPPEAYRASAAAHSA